jgi:hypothetical protein
MISMQMRHIVPLCAAVTLVAGCSQGAADKPQDTEAASTQDSKKPQQEETASSGGASEWNPKKGLQRAQRALAAYDDDGTHPRIVETDNPYVTTGMSQKFNTSGDRPYRLDIT